MDEDKRTGIHIISAAAFVEGGIQEACFDACSICLEEFCDIDPSTVTNCKHEFHLQCILEWCQRSSKCPMCWQGISLKDPASEELLEVVKVERSLGSIPARNATIFRHPTLGDFELQHLPVGVNNAELEDRIIQHLVAAAAAVGGNHQIIQREGSQNHPMSNGHEFLAYPAHPNGAPTGSGGEETNSTAATGNSLSIQVAFRNNQGMQHISSSIRSNLVSGSASGSLVTPNTGQGISNDISHVRQSSLQNQTRAGPLEHQSFSDTWRSRLSSMSTKYKESISRSTKEWKEKLFSRNSSMADIGSEVRREVNAGLTTVSRMMEHLETRNVNRADRMSRENTTVNSTVNVQSNNDRANTPDDIRLNGHNSASFAARSN